MNIIMFSSMIDDTESTSAYGRNSNPLRKIKLMMSTAVSNLIG